MTTNVHPVMLMAYEETVPVRQDPFATALLHFVGLCSGLALVSPVPLVAPDTISSSHTHFQTQLSFGKY